jgi:phage head maturation protease
MGWKFYGYAAVYGSPDRDRDIFAQGCFTGFLRTPDHLNIPMLNGHAGAPIGRWHRMIEDGFGLLVFGELNEDLGSLQAPFPGLSVTVTNAQGSPHPNPWGGQLCRFADLTEISIVESPAHHGARILGPWS